MELNNKTNTDTDMNTNTYSYSYISHTFISGKRNGSLYVCGGYQQLVDRVNI